jgi:hypothetical protein
VEAKVTAAVRPRPKATKNKHSTCAPSSKAKRLSRQLAGIMAHLQQHPNDQLSQARVAKITAMLKE